MKRDVWALELAKRWRGKEGGIQGGGMHKKVNVIRKNEWKMFHRMCEVNGMEDGEEERESTELKWEGNELAKATVVTNWKEDA